MFLSAFCMRARALDFAIGRVSAHVVSAPAGRKGLRTRKEEGMRARVSVSLSRTQPIQRSRSARQNSRELCKSRNASRSPLPRSRRELSWPVRNVQTNSVRQQTLIQPYKQIVIYKSTFVYILQQSVFTFFYLHIVFCYIFISP